VDAVDVVTPADSHLAIAETCLRAGRPCFVEKPLTVTAADGRRLAMVARETGRALQVGHIFRFHPVTAAIRTALMTRRLGRLRFATARFAGFKRPRTDVGVTHTDAIHYFDLFAYLFDQPATRVSAIQRDYLGRGLDDMSVTMVEYGDVAALVEPNYFVPGTWRERVLVGERGSVVADYDSGSVTLFEGEFRHREGGWEGSDLGKEVLAKTDAEPLRLELSAFLDACAGRSAVSVTAEDGLRAVQVVEAAAQAARLGRAVAIDEIR